jgi:protein O-GlcNAc transferase
MNNWNLKRAVDRIIDDQIDILIDLKGHTQGGNLEIFVSHPAKVTISWLGFPGTTGMDFIDYAIVDRVVVPKGEEKYWSEKLIFMPHSYRPADTATKPSKKKFKRSDFGLPTKGIIFSSFNNAYKIEPVMWKVWMNILKRVPSGTLWLWERFPEASKNLKKHAKSHGVDPKRLVFSKRLKKDEHLERIKIADIALDTRIVNGHTTTAETLRMGVPVVALYGKHFCSRVSASCLKAARLQKLVTKNLREYENLAVALATNPNKLKSVVHRLKANLKTSPFFNTKLFTRNLEKAFTKTWEIQKSGKTPKSFFVK